MHRVTNVPTLALTAVALLSASACTTFEETRPDMEARPLPSRGDEIAYINELRKAYRPDEDGAMPCYTGQDLKPFRPKYVQGYAEWDSDQEAKGRCVRFAPNPGDGPITSYLESGFGLTDLYCQRYFTIATETRQSRKLQRSFFKTGDTLLNAVMGALSVGANPIAISSAGFSAIDSGYGAVDDAFVVAPTREDVRKLVHGAQQKFRAEVFRKGERGETELPKSYAAARSTIERYAGLCTFDGMRQLVADAVATQTDALNTSAKKPAEEKKDEGGKKSTDGKKDTPAATPARDPGLIAPPPITAQ